MSEATSTSERPGVVEPEFRRTLDFLQSRRAVERLFARDASLWKSAPDAAQVIGNRLGWLDSPAWLEERIPELHAFAAEVRSGGFTRVLLLGMGGSSLAPEVIASVLRAAPGAPTLEVLDSTDPAAVRSAEATHRLDRTFFLVSSKSGRTIETLSQYRYFRARLDEMGLPDAGRRFAAITDPGSALERLAREEGVRRVFLNPSDIGGRYSALSYFGMVPAALLGVDLTSLAARAAEARERFRSDDPAENPALRLGALLGAAARAGRNKMTLLTSPTLRPLGYWIEQLVAESTGKEGSGILPVEGEPLGFPRYYSADRSFVAITLVGAPDSELERLGAELQGAGAPWAAIRLADRADLAAEFVRWEVATAIAGAALEINPFDEPNVQESKDRTSEILAETERAGRLPSGPTRGRDGGVEIFASDALWERLTAHAPAYPSLEMVLGRFFSLRRAGDYLALLAYVDRTAATESAFAQLRRGIRDATQLPVLQGYGPRYLHSIGQFYKGGPETGMFLVITADHAQDLPIPESRLTFGRLETAQALGDLASLDSRGKPALRLHMTETVTGGLATIAHAVERALVSQASA